MPVDKFGCTTSSGDSASQFNTSGLVHRAADTWRGNLSMGGNRLKDVGAPVEAATVSGR
jgi:hypothetical protein